MSSEFNLFINVDANIGFNNSSESDKRKNVASLLRIVALMLEQGRDVEKIRNYEGNIVGHYTLRNG